MSVEVKRRKNTVADILLCVICAETYILSLLGLTAFFVLLGGGELAQDFCDTALKYTAYGGIFGGIALGALSLFFAIWGGMRGYFVSRRVVAAVKIALVPCYIISLALWVPLWFHAIDLSGASFGDAIFLGISCVVNLYYFVCIPAATSLPLIAELIGHAGQERKPLCLFWIVPLVICFADVIAAILLWRREKNFSPPVVPPADQTTGAAGEAS